MNNYYYKPRIRNVSTGKNANLIKLVKLYVLVDILIVKECYL